MLQAARTRLAGSTQSSSETSVAPYKPDSLIVLVSVFMWVAVWRVQDIFPILAMVQLPILTQLSLIVLFYNDQSPLRKVEFIKGPTTKIIIAILVLMVLGMPTSLWATQSFMFLLKDFLPTLLLMLTLAASVRDERDLEWFAFAFLSGAALYCFIIFSRFEVGSDGRLGGLIYYDANDLAMLINCTIPFAVYFIRPGVKTWKRLFSIAAIGLFTILIIKSGSRGGFIGFVAVMGYILTRYQAVPARLRIGAAVAGIGILLVAGSSAYWEMMGTLLNPGDDYNMTADVGRSAVWKRGIGYMFDNPILGVGVRAFPQAEGMLSELAKQYAARGQGIKWSVAHNSFVEIGAELGVFGLLLFLALLGSCFVALARSSRKMNFDPDVTKKDSAFSQALFGSFIAYCICGFFISAEYLSVLYVLIGFVLAQQAIFRKRTVFGYVPETVPKSISTQGMQKPRPSSPPLAPAPTPAPAPAPSRGKPKNHWTPSKS